MKTNIYCTSFCNYGHLLDGRPVDHECYKLPAGAIEAEKRDDYEEAIRLINEARRKGRLFVHRGVKSGTKSGQPAQ